MCVVTSKNKNNNDYNNKKSPHIKVAHICKIHQIHMQSWSLMKSSLSMKGTYIPFLSDSHEYTQSNIVLNTLNILIKQLLHKVATW